MAKEVVKKIKLQIAAGKATPAPPVGTVLGPAGINLGEFCTKYNEATRDKMGDILPVEISIYDDRSFDFVIKTPPAAFLIKKYAKINKNVAIWVDVNYSKDAIKGLQEDGFVVIRKPFTIKTLKSKLFNKTTKYNFIYFNENDDESFVPFVTLFTNFLKETRLFNFHLYIEVSCEKAGVIKQEVIDKVEFKGNISLFNRYEL